MGCGANHLLFKETRCQQRRTAGKNRTAARVATRAMGNDCAVAL